MSLRKNFPHPAHLPLPPSRQTTQVNLSLLGGFFPVVDVTVMSSLQILHFTRTWTKLSLAFSSVSLKSAVMAKTESKSVAAFFVFFFFFFVFNFSNRTILRDINVFAAVAEI